MWKGNPIRQVIVAGEPDGAELEAERRQRLASLADQHFGAAAADVDEHEAPIEHRHRLQYAELDETGLLHPTDDLHVDPGLATGPLDERIGVLGLSHRARGYGVDGGATDLRHSTKALQRCDAAIDRVVVEHLHVTRARAETDHLLLAGDHLELDESYRLGEYDLRFADLLPEDPCFVCDGLREMHDAEDEEDASLVAN